MSYYYTAHIHILSFSTIITSLLLTCLNSEYQILNYLRFSPPEVSSHFKSVARLEHEEILVLTRSAEEWAVPRNRNNYGEQTLQFLVPVLLNR